MKKLTEKQRSEIAEFRFGLIAPVINGTFAQKSESEYFRNLCETLPPDVNGRSVALNVSTLKTWKKKYLEEGFKGLYPKKRNDQGGSRKIDPELEQEIDKLRIKFPKAPATTIYSKLVELNFIEQNDFAVCTLQRYFKHNPVFENRTTIQKDRRAYEAEFVNGIWQADSLYGPKIKSTNKRVYLQAIIDDKSRKIVAAHFYNNDNGANFQQTLKHAIAVNGIPLKLYVDNGSPYKNEQLSFICGELGIVLLHAPVRDGAAKGKIERFNRTLRIKFLNCIEDYDLKDIDTINNALARWINTYNNTLHTSINNTPNNIFMAGRKDIKAFDGDLKKLDEAFMNRITRKVSNDSTVKINNMQFDVPMGYIGKTVEIRWTPDDVNQVYLYDNGKFIHIVATNKAANANQPRIKPEYEINY